MTGMVLFVLTFFAMMLTVVMPMTGTAVISPNVNGTSKGGHGLAFVVPSNLTERQLTLLNSAYKIAKETGLKYPEILQGIVFQETHAGELNSYKVAGQEFGLKTNERYYGICQVKLAAAKDVLAANPSLKKKFDFHTSTDEEIIANLILNDEFNLAIAAGYLKLIGEKYGSGKEYMIASFNKGPGGARQIVPSELHYVQKVNGYIAKYSRPARQRKK